MSDEHPMRVWRKNAGKTLTQVANEVDVEPSYISDIERHVKQPSLTLAAKLSAMSGVPIDQFVKRTEAA